MGDFLGQSLRVLKRNRIRRRRILAILLALSVVVSMDVFWALRQPGWTLAGDADCKIVEHTHDASCEKSCPLTEHVHSLLCYSDDTADLETQLDWQAMFADYPFTDSLRKNLAGIAKTQVGYTESKQNFEVDSDGVRRGYTRYGAWYGAPYSDWSAMFVSFCLHYAGADPEQLPGNTGAASMAELWKKLGRFAAADSRKPLSGDLAFFTNNTAGIVIEVQLATAYVIRGDVDGTVRGELISLTDPIIAGWGLTETDSQEKNPLDISQGPAVFLYEGGQTAFQMRRYALRNTRAVTELLPYLEANGGDYFFTLLDMTNQELPKDANGNYIAVAQTGYKLTISFTSPEGFLPGTYQYQIPNGLMVDGGEGTFILKDGTNVGSWVVTDTGLITLVFNDQMNSRTDITISATLGIHFPDQEDPIDFDGQITVKVEKPPEQQDPTEIYKWGLQGGVPGSNGDDPTKLYWTAQIVGHQDSQIPGNILSDQVVFGQWSKTHHYTESDIAGGLTFGVAETDPATGEYLDWHNWWVSPDDPHLVWTETGWSYKIPKTVTCQWCGEIELGNNGWIYTVNYSSTPDRANNAGTYGYENQASIDGKHAYGWTDFTHGEVSGEIIKNGTYIADAGGGAFYWEFQAMIPARKEGQKADYHWYIMDYMYLLNENGYHIGYTENDAHLASVMVTYNGATFTVPKVQDATDQDMFAWDNAWTANSGGINYGREFNLLCRCQCNADNCRFWNGDCGEYWYQKADGTWATNGFCQCWAVEENVTFTFVYKTEDMAVIEKYGGLGYGLKNVAELYYKPDDAAESGALVDSDDASVTIPGLFKKELTHDFDGYTANYKVTVNESKLVLTDGSPLTIHDVMTKTLAYISGSLVITAEDADGNITTLQQDADYTVTYDGTGGQTDAQGNEVHVLDIVILHPQPVMYILDYDATLIMPEQVTGGVKYANSATVTLWGQAVTDSSVEKVYADINIAAKSYKVSIFKTCEATGEPLAGATFGLYNANGGLIATEVTTADGSLLFQTNIIEGIILREHILYYMQELDAPPGYQLDDTKYWFCFCDKTGNSCTVCAEVMADTNAVRIPFEQLGKVHVTNKIMNYNLPATGGTGVYPWILASVIFILTPLVYGFIRRRKQERRGVG